MGRPFGPRVVVSCEVCGVKQERRASSVATLNKTGRFFCSLKCRRQVSLKPFSGKNKPCKQCGAEFYVNKAGSDRFCSRACYDEHQRRKAIPFNCATCGKEYRLSPSQVLYRGKTKYCSIPCRALANTHRPAPRMLNSRVGLINRQGYVTLYKPDHPMARHGRVLEHRLVVEEQIGRFLTSAEHVHHINGVKTDNCLENLKVLSQVDHAKVTWHSQIGQIRELQAELAEYKRRFGPLKKES
jgi:hypothetical protein